MKLIRRANLHPKAKSNNLKPPDGIMHSFLRSGLALYWKGIHQSFWMNPTNEYHSEVVAELPLPQSNLYTWEPFVPVPDVQQAEKELMNKA
jgi:hypothetical protein